MKAFYRFIVDHAKGVLVVFLLLALVSALLQPLVAVNYEMKDYLPAASPSTVALDMMEENFTDGIPNARVMVPDVTLAEAMVIKEKIEAVHGVSAVTWLDDVVDVLEPLQIEDQDTVETYYKDGAALFSVTIDEEAQVEAVDAIRAVIGEEGAMTGDAVSTAVATTGTVSEIQKVSVVAVLFVLVVLTLTTHSWLEPFLILIGIGVAVIINAGTNLIFGEISFVTNAAGAVLQLAVSLDYSVFLIHRFEEYRRTIDDPKEAMVEALVSSTSSILSSGLTTVIGFFALIFMQFRIGPDLGLALAKGIAISLLTVFTFVPALTLLAQKQLFKWQHRRLLPDFHGFGRLVTRVMLPLVVLFVLVIAPAYQASGANEYYYGASHIYGSGTELGDDTAEIDARFGQSDTYALLVPRGDPEREQALSAALEEIPEVTALISYVDTVGAEIPTAYLDEETFSQLESDTYSRFVLEVNADYESAATFDLVERIRAVAEDIYPGTWLLAGNGVTAYDLMDTITNDTVKINLIAIGAVFLVLLLTMRSLSLPILLVLSIETAIWINFAIPYLMGSTVFYLSYLIVSSVQLGATVDYAILFTERYLEFRARLNKRQALIETIAVVTPSVITSGSVLAVVGLLLGAVSSHGVLSQLGHFLGVGSLLSLSIVLFVLPGLLSLCDRLIQRTSCNLNLYNE